MRKKYDAFLSYRITNSEDVQKILVSLEKAGAKVFFAPRDLNVGVNWQEAIHEALSLSRHFLVFIGDEGLSDMQKVEIGLALSQKESQQSFGIFPVLLPGVKKGAIYKEPIAQFQWIDLSTGITDNESLYFLVDQIKEGWPIQSLLERGVFRGKNRWSTEFLLSIVITSLASAVGFILDLGQLNSIDDKQRTIVIWLVAFFSLVTVFVLARRFYLANLRKREQIESEIQLKESEFLQVLDGNVVEMLGRTPCK